MRNFARFFRYLGHGFDETGRSIHGNEARRRPRRTADLRHHRRQRWWRDLFSLQFFAEFGPYAGQPRKPDDTDDGRRDPSAVLYYSRSIVRRHHHVHFLRDFSSLPDDRRG